MTRQTSASRESPRELLVVFSRYPVAGRAKTRLIPALGADGAATLHRELAERALDTARAWRERGPSGERAIAVWYTGGSAEQMRAWLGDDLDYQQQPEGDLGARMAAAFFAGHDAGAAVAIIGTDCPALSAAHLEQAFALLETAPLVLGPCHDGGYYLIAAASAPPAAVFEQMPWGSDAVLALTEQRARSAGAEPRLLEHLDDVDRPEDLPEARRWLDTAEL